MKIAIATWGSRGDYQPYLALARGFARAGHEVRLAGPRLDVFAADAVEQGIPYVALGPPPDPKLLEGMVDRMTRMRDPAQQARLIFEEYGTPWLAEVYEQCLDLGRWCDVLVAHFFQFAGRMTADSLGVPFITGTLSHMQVPSRHLAPPLFPNLGPTANRLIWRFGSMRGDALWGRGLNRARRRLGFPPLRDLLGDGLYARDLNLIAVSRHVTPSPPDWTPRHRLTGYWFLDQPDWTPPVELAAFVLREPRPIAIGFGSMATGESSRLTRLIVRAAALAGVRVILQAGWAGLGNADLPSSVFAVGDVPHDWLFPRVSAVVHHGGAGTTAAVFRAGVPSVFVPHIVDQYFWADAARKLGVAPKPVPRRQLTPERLAGAINEAMHDAAMRTRAARLGAAIRGEDGVGTAVRLVEEYVARGSSERGPGP